jgi:ATP-dependent HslUV protease ATP-binding subunit HslU
VSELTPLEVVRELDAYIVGQQDAKRAVAIAVRNRWRRLQLEPEIAADILPKNIIMIGPTGVGKTEIARRLAQMVEAPFVKVEASRYTEVGYYGRDVETMVRDLVEVSMKMVNQKKMDEVRAAAEAAAEERLLDLLLPMPTADYFAMSEEEVDAAAEEEPPMPDGSREKMRKMLRDGKLEEREVELEIEEKAVMMQGFVAGPEEMGFDFQNILDRVAPTRSRTRKVTIAEARKIVSHQEGEKLIDRDAIVEEAIRQAENSGIIFLDEIDKVASREGGKGPDVSREGVQRDLLPIVEGTSVNTRHGIIKTDHILFIAAGAFHVAKPSDMIPELQGRFPIRVELNNLTTDDFVRILTEPKNALTRQYVLLLGTEKVTLDYQEDAVRRLAEIAADVNKRAQNIGARRLQTVMEKLLEEVSFHAPNMDGQTVTIDIDYVNQRLEEIIKDDDLTRYIL